MYWCNAKFPGECFECGEHFNEGDRIVYDFPLRRCYCKECGEELTGFDDAVDLGDFS